MAGGVDLGWRRINKSEGGGAWGDAMTRRIFTSSFSKKSRFLTYARHFSGGGTLIKNLATLEHNKRDLLCSNVAIIRRSIARGVEYPPARVDELVMNWIGAEGGAKSEIGEARFLARSDQIPTRIFEVLELIFPPDFFEKKTGGRGSPGPSTLTALGITISSIEQ